MKIIEKSFVFLQPKNFTMNKNKDSEWYNDFIKTVSNKYHKPRALIEKLMELLGIDDLAARRRLQKKVLFSLDEIEKISVSWNISLDEIMGIGSDSINFKVYRTNFYNPQKKDYEYLQKTAKFLEGLKDNVGSEYIEVCNKLPRFLLVQFPQLLKFYTFRWINKYDLENCETPYPKIIISDKMQKTIDGYLEASKKIKKSNYIFDRFLFENLIADIQYFHEIEMITDAEKELLKKDLFGLKVFLEKTTKTGFFPKTENEVNFYISRVNIDTNYSCFYSKEGMVFRIHVLGEYECKNYDPETVLLFKKLLELKKKSSNLISVTGETVRIQYFKKLQGLIDGL